MSLDRLVHIANSEYLHAGLWHIGNVLQFILSQICLADINWILVRQDTRSGHVCVDVIEFDGHDEDVDVA